MARILLIEDDSLVRRTVRRILELHRHCVSEASNGTSGMEMFTAGDFDMVITDILMPEKEGIETIREIRSVAPDIPIIAISGGGQSQTADYLVFAKSLGADQSLKKPFSPAQLIDLVDGCLRR